MPLRLEQLPKVVLCIPLVLQWLWLALLYRSLTLPSSVNPAIETGGLAGESKSACLAQIAAEFAGWIAEWRRVGPGDDPVACRGERGLDYPLIAKPDIGWCGYGVQRIGDDGELRDYAKGFPRDGAFVIQRLVTAPNEAGLFYVRAARAPAGRLVAMTLRHPPHVVGNGDDTVAALIAADPDRSARRPARSTGLASCVLDRVPAAGERVALTIVASLRAGARYEDATAAVTDALALRVDAIARSMPEFHFGRFDVRFGSMEALQRGEFSIIEVNGAGAEAIQFWDPVVSLAAGFRGVFAKQKQLFALGADMRRDGHAPVGVGALARAWLRQHRLIRRYPPSQ